jgi:hypothetical protein
VYLSHVREGTGYALIGARQWIPREHIEDPVKCLRMGCRRLWGSAPGVIWPSTSAPTPLPAGSGRTCTAGGEVHGSCGELRGHSEAQGQAYVLRVPSSFMLTLAAGPTLTCAQAIRSLLPQQRRWEVRSAGGGSKGERWYAWVWLPTASPRHHPAHPPPPQGRRAGVSLLLRARRPDPDQGRLIRAAGLHWPVAEDFEFGKDCFGLDQCPARLYTAILRHAVLVIAGLAICAVTAALLKDRTDTQALPPACRRPAATAGSSGSSPPSLPGP